jgi:hypothetical protein
VGVAVDFRADVLAFVKKVPGELHEDEANFAFDRLRDIDNGILTRAQAQAAVNDAFREMAVERAKTEAAAAANAEK